ncbi:hypothetical protein MP228_008641 [Amoeboaphelidium protococcarum]|nr:hypothetical protein MP228_008641 [Amoeboaphelidium protococcarum]
MSFKQINIIPQNVSDLEIEQVCDVGDINGDSYADMLVLTKQNALIALIYNVNLARFDYAQEYSIGNATLQSLQNQNQQLKIVHAALIDLNYDGRLDIIITFSNPQQSQSKYTVKFALNQVSTDDNRWSELQNLSSDSAVINQKFPLAVNWFGQKEQVGLLYDQTLYTMNRGGQVQQRIISLGDGGAKCEHVADEHSSAVIDLNGDCISELLMECKDRYQVYEWDQSLQQYQFSQSYQLLQEATNSASNQRSLLQFMDLNGDSLNDIVYTWCRGDECFIDVILATIEQSQSSQLPSLQTLQSINVATRGGGAGLCNKQNVKFDFLKPSRISLKKIEGLTDAHLIGDGGHLRVLQFVDVNLDGYMDIVIQVRTGSQQSLRILLNRPCDSKSDHNGVICLEGGRTFSLMTDGVQRMQQRVTNVRQVVPIDIGSNGLVDFVMLNGQKLDVFVNRMEFDSYFLKVFITNGVCFKDCKSNDDDDDKGKEQDNNALQLYPMVQQSKSSYYMGSAFKFTVYDIDGHRRVITGIGRQYLRSPPMPPVYGLGRTNNYIEQFECNVVQSVADSFQFSGLIPNSQVLVHPPSQANASAISTVWIIQLIVSPSHYIFWISIVLLSVSSGLLLAVYLLKKNEQKMDMEERRREMHLLNFDAL